MTARTHIRASVGAITAKAALFTLMALALPTGALASSQGRDALAEAGPAAQYAARVAGEVSASNGAARTSMPNLPAATATVTSSGGAARIPVAPVPAPPAVARYPAVVSQPAVTPRPAVVRQSAVVSPSVKVASPVSATAHSASDPAAASGILQTNVRSMGRGVTSRPAVTSGPGATSGPGVSSGAGASNVPGANSGAGASASNQAAASVARVLSRVAESSTLLPGGAISIPIASPVTLMRLPDIHLLADIASASWPPAALPDIHLLADIASASWPPAVVGDGLSAVPSLIPQLPGLLSRVETSVLDHQWPQRASVIEPPVTRPRGPYPSSLPAGVRGLVEHPDMWRSVSGVDAAPSAHEAISTPTQTLGRSSNPVPSQRRSSGAPGVAHRSSPSSVSASVPLPISSSFPAGAAAGASGGIGAGAAAAVLAVAMLWLLQALLPGRLALDLCPWRSAMLVWRLERPG